MTTAPAPTPAAPAAGRDPDPIAETVATIDVLIARHVALTGEAARLRQELADLHAEQELRKAHRILAGLPGRNEAERSANLTVDLAADADYRRLRETERATRQRLVETEAEAWAARQRLSVCLALLKLAATDDDTDAGADADGAAGADR